MKGIATLLLILFALTGKTQIPDHVYDPGIHSVKLYKYGDIFSYPIMRLNSGDMLELHFDDLGTDIKYCYYTYQLCNVDWTPANLQYYDYIRGFQSMRITTYRNSSIATTRYVHYQATLPDRNSVPTMPGNYLLKVFLNNDTSQLLFTKRFLVVDPRVAVAAKMMQPFKVHSLRTSQRVQVAVSTVNTQINTLSPQDLKVIILQNNIWPTALFIDRPTIYRGNYYEYNHEDNEFPGGREWRWLDIRSLRLRGDRVQKIVDTANRVDVYVNNDGERRSLLYTYYRDQNGIYTIVNADENNPYWQGDYCYAHFTYVPPGNRPYPGKDIYIFGELTNYASDEAARMIFNEEKGVYEATLFLKQGYYDYKYISVDTKEGAVPYLSFETTEGSFNSTENNYTVLIYYRAFGARADELIGFAQLGSTIVR